MSRSRRRRAVDMLVSRLDLSQRRACAIVGQHRSTQRHQPAETDPDRDLRARLGRFARQHPRWGYRRAHAVVRRDGYAVNRKKLQRLWRDEGLRVPPKRRKRQRLGVSTTPADRLRAERPDHVWALDYQFDVTATGRVIKIRSAGNDTVYPSTMTSKSSQSQWVSLLAEHTAQRLRPAQYHHSTDTLLTGPRVAVIP